MKIFVILLMLFIHEALQYAPGDGKIIGGSPADIKDFPHQISLQYIGDHICGGSIIGQKFVLTAAHCTNEHDIRFLNIRYGTSIHDDGGVIVDVEEVLQHPSFNPATYDFDISVLKLKEEIVLSDTAKIIKMIDVAQNIPAGTVVQVSGWGYTKEGGSFSDHLREVSLPVVSHTECTNLYEPAPITDRMICAGYVGTGGKDACQGDSGGPLIVDNKLVGVVSWGEGCARPEYPGIFANVSNMRLFIKDVSGI